MIDWVDDNPIHRTIESGQQKEYKFYNFFLFCYPKQSDTCVLVLTIVCRVCMCKCMQICNLLQ